jgi:gliding motility-associated-like protein
MKKIVLLLVLVVGIVVCNAQSGATITTQPVSQSVCDGATVTLSITATGIKTILYRWQFFDPIKSVFNDIASPSAFYSGVTTSTLSFNTTGNAGAGIYRCRTRIDFDVFSNNATISINALPTAATTTGNSACGPSSLTLNAAGGKGGQYRWYTVASGGSAIAGEVNSSYVTPSLSATTTYHVSINNGCESTRTPVVATINTIPAIPVTSGNSSCVAAAITLNASGGTKGQYRWYTVASGGTAIIGEDNSSYVTPLLTTTTTYYVSINNGTCESARASVNATIDPLPCIPPVISTVPLATQVEGKIVLNLVPLITTTGILDVPSIKIIVQPSSGATATITNGVLTIDYKGKLFSGTEALKIEACNVTGACSQREFKIDVAGEVLVYNAVSPNDDKKNDFLYLQYIDVLSPKNQVSIYNRWGDEVFSVSDYDNKTRAFAGLTNGGNKLPVGTYYYKIALFTTGKSMTGFLQVKY